MKLCTINHWFLYHFSSFSVSFSVYFFVLVEVTGLFKSLSTSRDITHIRPCVIVYSLMVFELVLEVKTLCATLEVTNKSFLVFLC